MHDELIAMMRDVNTVNKDPVFGYVGRSDPTYGDMDPLAFIQDVDRYLAALFDRGELHEVELTDRAKEILAGTGNNYYFIDTPIAKSDMETIIRQTELTEAMA